MTFTREEIYDTLNALYVETGADVYFDPPVMGVADANDPFWRRFKGVIGETHWTPQEALEMVAPGAEARSVICWILPKNEAIRAANRRETEYPAPEWARARTFGEMANEAMRLRLCEWLAANGHPSTAPHLNADYAEAIRTLASTWSERHAAFVAGLGTFGLSSGLITMKGVAIRVGSVVTALELPADARPYGDDPFAWCAKCGACAGRCPAGAIGATIQERDKEACRMYAYERIESQRAARYGFPGPLGCGLCQTGVPCENQRPC